MQLRPDEHHDRCPVCGQRFLGFTDADMILHIVDEHEGEIADYVDLPKKEEKECDNCQRTYVTYQGACPFCRHGGEPYK